MLYLVRFLIDFLVLFLGLTSRNKVKSLVAENLILKQQLHRLRRKTKWFPPLNPTERIVFGLLAMALPIRSLKRACILIKPATVLKFHRALIKRKYSELFCSKQKSKPGPKGPTAEVIKSVVEMKKLNPRMGCPKIAATISLKFGVSIDKNIVKRILAKCYYPEPSTGGPSWLSFIGNSLDSLWSIDFFRVESVGLKSYWVLVVMDQFSRQIVGFRVCCCNSLDGLKICRMFNNLMFSLDGRKPKYLSRDNDPLFMYSA